MGKISTVWLKCDTCSVKSVYTVGIHLHGCSTWQIGVPIPWKRTNNHTEKRGVVLAKKRSRTWIETAFEECYLYCKHGSGFKLITYPLAMISMQNFFVTTMLEMKVEEMEMGTMGELVGRLQWFDLDCV